MATAKARIIHSRCRERIATADPEIVLTDRTRMNRSPVEERAVMIVTESEERSRPGGGTPRSVGRSPHFGHVTSIISSSPAAWDPEDIE
jgi:hypothetical protein